VVTLSKSSLFTLAVVPLLLPAAIVKFVATNPPREKSMEVARSYLGVTLARDYREAYRFISAADRRVANQEDYVQAQGGFSGFALQLAKMIAAQVEFRLVEQEIKGDGARLTLDYKVPAADEVSALLFNWDQDRLNALSLAEQQRIIGALEKMKKAGNMINIEGREILNLVKEDGRWKVFLDWASGIRVSFDAAVPLNNAIDVVVLKRKLFAGTDEPFQTNLKIKNRGPREIVARIDHRIEPKEFAGRIAMIACGFLRPLTLYPGEVREVSSAYLLDSSFPRDTTLSITFAFNLASAPRADSVGK
jgi:hypothetical protein